jgi:serine/threonine protein kinase
MPPIIRPPAPGEQPGVKKLGRYECTEPLGGDGGFETYRGRVKGLAGLDRSFAVKVLRLKRSESASAIVEPFIKAAKRSAALANPRIATVVDTGSDEGVVFAVTPFIEGLDLSHFLAAAREAGVLVTGKDDRARQWYSMVAYAGAEIARGLHAAHTQAPPLVHGALCPGNVFITSRGAVRLLDFGLRAAVRRPFEPRPRRLLPYIAPELASPAATGTMAGDMYSLGVLLGELASGDPPPQTRRASEMKILIATLPEDLGSLIGRLVSVSAAARPSAEEAISLLTGSYADTSEASLVSAVSSLVQNLVNSRAQPQTPAENDGASQAGSEAPPPSLDLENDTSSVAPLSRSPEPMGPPPVADLSMPEPVNVDGDLPMRSDLAILEPDVPEETFSSDPTTIDKQPPVEDLHKQGRPTEPLGRSTASRHAAIHLTSAAETPASTPPPRGPTRPGFSPAGNKPAATPPPVPAAARERSGFSGEWASEPGAVAHGVVGPRPHSLPSLVPEPVHAQPVLAKNDQAPPSLMGFEKNPATWGARALASLGGQAGIAPSVEAPGLGLLDQGLLDQVEDELANSMSPAGPPPAEMLEGVTLRNYENPSSSGSPLAGHDVPLGLALPGPDDTNAAEATASVLAQMRQGHVLLEDQLVDAPEGMPAAPSWPEADSAVYGAADGHGIRLADPPAVAKGPPAEVAEVIASVVGEPVLPEAHAFQAENAPPAPPTTAAYFDDSAKPLADEPLPAQAAKHAPTMIAFALPRGQKPASTAQVPATFPNWAKSPDSQNRPKRKWVRGLAGIVLGASVVLGGLAGFMASTRSKPVAKTFVPTPAPGGVQRQVAPQEQVDDSLGALQAVQTKPAEPDERTATGKTPVADQGKDPAPSAKEPSAKTSPSGKTDKPGGNAAAPAPSEKAPPKQAQAAAPAKGAADAPGSGEVVNVAVASQPEGATVWINGKERGRTPLEVKVQAGPARVVIILAGHALAAADISASEGAKVTKQLTAIEPPLAGEARFRAECATQGKLPITIDGKETGVLCPFSKLRVDPGVHKIGLFVPSLGTVREKEVTLHPGVRSIVFTD